MGMVDGLSKKRTLGLGGKAWLALLLSVGSCGVGKVMWPPPGGWPRNDWRDLPGITSKSTFLGWLFVVIGIGAFLAAMHLWRMARQAQKMEIDGR